MHDTYMQLNTMYTYHPFIIGRLLRQTAPNLCSLACVRIAPVGIREVCILANNVKEKNTLSRLQYQIQSPTLHY